MIKKKGRYLIILMEKLLVYKNLINYIGVAYKNLKNMDLFPAFSFCDTGDVVKIVKAKFK
jgi:hypothetical protein